MKTKSCNISLNGVWDFVVDMDPKYHLDKRIYQVVECAQPEMERRHWLKVPVPGVWQKYAERYDIYEGICWFSKHFKIDEFAAGATAKIRFGAVNYLCHVYINGKKVGEHETGYTEFVLDITEQLRQGDNHIAVMVDNRATVTKWPPCLGYFNYGGIHRDVTIEITDRAILGKIVIDAAAINSSGLLKVRGIVARATAKMQVNVACAGGDTTVNIATDGSFELSMSVFDIELWSPANPQLYLVKISLLNNEYTIDETEKQCGFRTIAMAGNQIMLNSAPLKIKGICYVYDSPTYGLVMTEEQINIDIALIKEMGCNMIRSHYPMNENFYQACDKAGIMIWIEPTVYCMHPGDDETNTEFSDPEYCRLAKQMIVEMIANARNHPSIALYGIGNECNTSNKEADEFFRMLAQTITDEDDSRLVSYAALYGRVGALTDIVDVLGINSYWGWYDKIFGGKGLEPEERNSDNDFKIALEPIDLTPMREMLDKVIAEGNNDMALLLTEFGADSVPGNFSKSRDLWSENYHADLLTAVIELTKEYPQIAGTCPFTFSDYRDPSKYVNGYWNEINLKGTVDYHRNKKLSFEAIKTAYNNKDI